MRGALPHALCRCCYPQGIDDLLDVIRQIEVMTESVLFALFESTCSKTAVAVLVIDPACLGVTWMVIVTVLPTLMVPRRQVTVAVPEQVP